MRKSDEGKLRPGEFVISSVCRVEAYQVLPNLRCSCNSEFQAEFRQYAVGLVKSEVALAPPSDLTSGACPAGTNGGCVAADAQHCPGYDSCKCISYGNYGCGYYCSRAGKHYFCSKSYASIHTGKRRQMSKDCEDTSW